MRRRPPPLRVTSPPPSSTMVGPWALTTLAVACIAIVTGSGPQLNRMMPPAATAATTAADVQLAAEPVPMTRVGREVSTARASGGTAARPAGLPGANARGGVDGATDGAEADGPPAVDRLGVVGPPAPGPAGGDEQPATSMTPVRTPAARHAVFRTFQRQP